jgi:hypothetical protein
MYLIVIGWLYVVLMMAVAEATHSTGTLVGAILTFVLYGALPVSLVVYLIATPRRRRAAKARESAELAGQADGKSGAPDAGREASADPIAPVRKEP